MKTDVGFPADGRGVRGFLAICYSIADNQIFFRAELSADGQKPRLAWLVRRELNIELN
jgi:hypothetical protein